VRTGAWRLYVVGYLASSLLSLLTSVLVIIYSATGLAKDAGQPYGVIKVQILLLLLFNNSPWAYLHFNIMIKGFFTTMIFFHERLYTRVQYSIKRNGKHESCTVYTLFAQYSTYVEYPKPCWLHVIQMNRKDGNFDIPHPVGAVTLRKKKITDKHILRLRKEQILLNTIILRRRSCAELDASGRTLPPKRPGVLPIQIQHCN
jgi:hypothetical protein